VIAGSQGAQLSSSALARPARDFLGVGVLEPSTTLDRLQVVRYAETDLDRPPSPAFENPVELVVVEGQIGSRRTDSGSADGRRR
jgi:hypothetical protein